ncbi:hypothetical protein [Marinobacter sp.]|uniref:hypothetical protein n=1 Tax=Marinobacter sp. TaxID=50741 RepID=UPI0019A43F63|nr:hypothetical protein [Marinobacter sp.]MBC7193861.1 hypothetical protein [Marinobacter sp.]
MALLNVQKASLTGLAPTFVAASAGGDSFVNDGKTVLHVKNGGASEITVTVNSQQPCNYGFDHDVTVAVPAGGERIIGPFRQDRFNNSDGQVMVSYSAVTSVTVAAIAQ